MENRKKRLVYQATKRGCKETELLLQNLTKINFESITDVELSQYEKLLEMNDNDLYSYLFSVFSGSVDGDNSIKKLLPLNKK